MASTPGYQVKGDFFNSPMRSTGKLEDSLIRGTRRSLIRGTLRGKKETPLREERFRKYILNRD